MSNLAAMCAACVSCSGRDLARQYASHSCAMTSRRSLCVQTCSRLQTTAKLPGRLGS